MSALAPAEQTADLPYGAARSLQPSQSALHKHQAGALASAVPAGFARMGACGRLAGACSIA